MDIDDAAKRSAELENAAEAVHHAKLLLVDLDRRQNMNREGTRVLKGKPRHDNFWVLCPGGVFLQGSQPSVFSLLEAESEKFKSEIEIAREALKTRVVELARLEGPDSALEKLSQGFQLRP